MPPLPTVGGSSNTWGNELNAWLQLGHNADGSHRPVFNVREMGAVGDSFVDDTTAIQNALNAAAPSNVRGVVYIPPGFYRITAPLVLNGSYVTVMGAGRLQSQLQVKSGGADLAAVIRLGVTGLVQEVVIKDLTIEGGSDAGHTTGHGITINGQVFIKDVYVAHTPQDGVSMVTTGQVFQSSLEDVYINLPGRDGLSIGTNHYDCDFTRVYIRGGASGAAKGGRYGIYNKGTEMHFFGCHPYFMATDGFRGDAGSVQIIGGEYESNGGMGVYLLTQTGDSLIQGVTGFYGNVSADVNIESISQPIRVLINGCSFTSTGVSRNVLLSANQISVSGCSFKNGTSEALMINTTSHCTIVNNIFDTTSAATRSFVILAGTHNTVVGNVVAPTNPKPMVESGAANYNAFVGNSLNGAAVTIVGANSVSSGNV